MAATPWPWPLWLFGHYFYGRLWFHDNNAIRFDKILPQSGMEPEWPTTHDTYFFILFSFITLSLYLNSWCMVSIPLLTNLWNNGSSLLVHPSTSTSYCTTWWALGTNDHVEYHCIPYSNALLFWLWIPLHTLYCISVLFSLCSNVCLVRNKESTITTYFRISYLILMIATPLVTKVNELFVTQTVPIWQTTLVESCYPFSITVHSYRMKFS